MARQLLSRVSFLFLLPLSCEYCSCGLFSLPIFSLPCPLSFSLVHLSLTCPLYSHLLLGSAEAEDAGEDMYGAEAGEAGDSGIPVERRQSTRTAKPRSGNFIFVRESLFG